MSGAKSFLGVLFSLVLLAACGDENEPAPAYRMELELSSGATETFELKGEGFYVIGEAPDEAWFSEWIAPGEEEGRVFVTFPVDLPGDGVTLDALTPGLFEYNDRSGNQYKNDTGGSASAFSLSLERWSGGVALGNFSGELRQTFPMDATGSLQIVAGSFEAPWSQ